MDNIVAFYRINIYDWIDLTFKLLGMDRYQISSRSKL